MRAGSVLLHAGAASFQSPGGGENQLIQTGRYLEPLGLNVRPFVSWSDRLERGRVLHLFGMSREGLELATVAKSRGVPVVLSPICWVEPRAIAALAPNRPRAAWDLAKWTLKSAVPAWRCWRRDLLCLADVILPNSRAEARQLTRLFGADPDRIRVVPNGVEPRFAAADASAFHDRFGDEPFVLYTGRIEPRKNVLGLVRSLADSGLRLVVLGDVVPGHEAYDQACRAEGGGAVTWAPRVEHEDPLLASAYAAARVLALPSWFETPGLSALEAALAGTSIVITPFGCTREYFGTCALYARPDRAREIAGAIHRAWVAGPNTELATLVAKRYLWTEVARQTAEVYDQVAA
jgi:glycosyltransferase involved in cell wall biosynthesis